MISLRARLSLGLSAVLLAAGALLAVGLKDFPRQIVEDFVLSRLQHDADLLYARVAGGDTAAEVQESAGSLYQLPLSGHYFRIAQGDAVILSRSLWDEDLALPEPASSGARAASQTIHIPGPAEQRLLVFTRHFTGEDGQITVSVAEDVSQLEAAIVHFRQRMLAGVGVALVLLLLLQRHLLARGLAPLRDAAAACRRLERGDITPLPATAPDEIRPMLDAVNRLARHHGQRLGRIRHAVGNLSHALKNPLAVLGQSADDLEERGDAELAATLRGQIDTMYRTIERELRRARLSGGGPPGSGFDPRSQLPALVEVLRRLYGEHIAIELDIPEEGYAFDREDLLELFGNLLDNACKWARSRVRLGIAPAAAGELVFCVEDDGPGAPEALLNRLGGAGLRADEQTPGHGLGLSIVADIVAQYDGAISYGRSKNLGGLRVEGRLPTTAG